MMISKCILTLCILLLASIPESQQEKICHKLLRELAEAQKNFVQCSTTNSVPVTLCIGCEQDHMAMSAAYTDLAAIANCSKQYFDQDRLNVVFTMQGILNDLWSKAFCDDCYYNNTHSNTTDDFNKKFTDLDSCLTAHQGNECVACLMKYQNLNNFFISMDQEKNGRVCFDLQDKMNRTRSLWSKEFKCCHREFNSLYFLLASSLICVLPVLFYGGMYALTKRRERYHDLLNVDPDLHDPTPTTSSAALENNATADSADPAKEKILVVISNDDEESCDDEMLMNGKKV